MVRNGGTSILTWRKSTFGVASLAQTCLLPSLGEQTSLENKKLVRKEFGYSFKARFAAENLAVWMNLLKLRSQWGSV